MLNDTRTQGMQRFGNADVSTHAIGLALLQQRWEHAVSLIMQDRDFEPEEVREARRLWNNGEDAAGALKKLPRQAVAERAGVCCVYEPVRTDERIVMEHIAKQKTKSDTIDFLSALGTVSRPSAWLYDPDSCRRSPKTSK
jgi:hypothetical protein